MSCNNPDVTVAFPATGLEIRPYSLNIKVDNGEFDFARGKFSVETGDYIRPHVQTEGGSLRYPQPVEIYLEGEKSHYLYFRPEYVTFGETNTFIEFHDPLKHLESEIVDFNIDMSTAKESYKMLHEVVKENSFFNILKDIDFRISPNAKTSKNEDTSFDAAPNAVNTATETERGPSNVVGDVARGIVTTVSNWTKAFDEEPSFKKEDVADTKFEFDVKNSTVLDALMHINEELSLSAFVDKDGVLVVGDKFQNQTHHFATDEDNRAWIYDNVKVQPPENPIRLVVLNGGMIDAPDKTEEDWKGEAFWEFIDPNQSHQTDLISQGIAERTNLDYGKIVTKTVKNVSRDGLENLAFETMKEQMRRNHSGSVEINPQKSSKRFSNYTQITPNDVINLIPPTGNCASFEQDSFLITGLEHDISGGDWSIELKIKKQVSNKDAVVTTNMRYFSPKTDKYYDDEFEELSS